MLTTDTKAQINDLIQINIDSGEGYRYAASAVADADLQKIFNANSRTREQFAKQLQSLMSNYGAEPEDDGSVKAALHRTWMTFKADLSTNNESSVVEECIRGDEEALELYDEVIPGATLPQAITNAVAVQHEKVKTTLSQLKEWKNIFEHNAVNT